MVFSSLFFLFVFFIANYIAQALMPDIRKKNIVMLSFSLVFYSCAGLGCLLLMLGLTGICWGSALLISRRKIQREKKNVLIGCVVLVLLILGIFKYTGFFLQNFQALFGVPEQIPTIILPIGISFYTFQLLSYVIDVYRGDAEVQEKYWLLLLYASLFHQCIAGPIVRYRDVNYDILHRKVKIAELSRGITRFAVGLAKKAVLANGCAAIVNGALGLGNGEPLTTKLVEATSVTGMWLVMIAFTLQIYLDFSAYSDMAIGMGLMCGFHYKENFNYPYIADSVTDFWRRWHISLSTFFRDYVYIPLGGNRKGLARQLLNLLIVWALTGLWHGAGTNFLLWGLYFFVFLALEKLFLGRLLAKLPKFVGWLYTLPVVAVSWMIFACDTPALLGSTFRALFGANGFSEPLSLYLLKSRGALLILCAVVASGLPARLWQSMKRRIGANAGTLCEIAASLPALALTLSFLIGDSYNPFLYFRF